MNTAFDVIIVGGVIAGSSTAIRLAQLFNSAAATWKKILVIDERTTNTEILKVGESLPGETKHILKSLGVFEAVNNSLRSSNELHDTSTIFNAYGNGFHLNRFLFDETLLVVKTTELHHDRFITIIRDSVTKSLLEKNGDGEKYWKISISSNELPIHGNIPSMQVAVAASFENTTIPSWSPALSDGGTRVFYLTSNESLFSIPVKHINKKRKIRQVEEFCEFIKETTTHITKCISEHAYHPVGKRIMCMPANSESLSQFALNLHMSVYIQIQSKPASYENRWIAIGDSAASFDPLSSQGMLTALYSAKLGAEAIFFQYFNGKKTNNKEITVQPLENFQQYIENTFRKYKSEKSFFYNKEQRWNNEVFWKRRHEDHIEK
ncbi:NAD(P)/FAD-dependent oxidoreductase [Rhizophagus clarus]|uniref:NAD(P)/FAD-dependent oxidoreductase n=1 Tax=Rhizophagus clarus TaxID=94130 RepID=A0A8H3R034_9GLOM|nr:NAD(P)/FAD-dependent oxidoreductase [Rhizophagus clarus]